MIPIVLRMSFLGDVVATGPTLRFQPATAFVVTYNSS